MTRKIRKIYGRFPGRKQQNEPQQLILTKANQGKRINIVFVILTAEQNEQSNRAGDGMKSKI